MSGSTSTTKTGPRKLSEAARHLVLPSGIVTSGWPAVRGKLAELGIRFDPWQVGAARCILSKRADGQYAAGIGGVVISIPRQVGKTFLLAGIIFALCLLKPDLTVIWTAHQVRTAAETFRAMQGFAKRAKVRPHIKRVVLGSGDEAIEFANGSRILFGARERGFGLGFSQVDILVIDEAQRVTERTMDDMVPTMNQSENPLLFLIGTPPRPTDSGEVFRARRAEALSGTAEDMVFIEMSADPDCDPATWEPGRPDWAQVAIANVSFPDRTNRAAILRMVKNLGSPESVRREALGIWDEVAVSAGVDHQAWAGSLDASASHSADVVLAVDVNPSRTWSTIVAAGLTEDERLLVEVTSEVVDGVRIMDHRPGVTWVVPRLREIVKRLPMGRVRLLARSQAETLYQPLIEAGVDVELVAAVDYTKQVSQFVDALIARRIVHLGQPDLDAAVGVAVLVPVGEEQSRWGRKKSQGEIGPLVAATLAVAALDGPESAYEDRGLEVV
ncbi:MAG TPA: hypothetical protein PKM36_11610 [Propionibacteriaceae bacterium]|nr:hypothetical protein [Propionibacteriaceae bacterium]